MSQRGCEFFWGRAGGSQGCDGERSTRPGLSCPPFDKIGAGSFGTPRAGSLQKTNCTLPISFNKIDLYDDFFSSVALDLSAGLLWGSFRFSSVSTANSM